MPHLERNKSYIPNLDSQNAVINGTLYENGSALTPNTAAGVAYTVADKIRAPRLIDLTLTNVSISITAANDYGSVKIADLPAKNVMILGGVANLTFTGDAVITDVTVVDYALGTVALTSLDFSNAGEKDIMPEKDVAAEGVAQNVTTDTEKNNVVAKNGDIYLNAQATIGSDAAVTVSGTIKLLVIDLGDEAA